MAFRKLELAALNTIVTNTGAAPTGGATAAKQDTGNTSLASLVTQTDGIEGSVDGIEGLLGGTGSIKDAHAGWTTIIGVSGIPVVSADLTSRTAVTSAPTNKLVVTDIIVSADTAMSVLFEEETSNDDKLKIFLPANGTAQITPRGKLKLAVAAKKLMATASATGNISILVLGYDEV